RRRRALYPAPRRPEGLHQSAGREDARLRRLRREPPVHHAEQPRRERSRLPVPARFCAPTADQTLGPRARGRRRPGIARAARRSWLSRAPPARVEAWDVNCSQHITARFTEAEIEEATAALRGRIAALGAEK